MRRRATRVDGPMSPDRDHLRLAAELAASSGLARRLLGIHRASRSGRCTACTFNGHPDHYEWPCRIAGVAQLAISLEDRARRGRQPAAPSGSSRRAVPHPAGPRTGSGTRAAAGSPRSTGRRGHGDR
jgi:hypothetical protein